MLMGIAIVLTMAGVGPVDEPTIDTALSAHPTAHHIMWSEASDHVGEDCFVYGRVVAASSVGQWCFLNFHEDFRRHFSTLIARHNLERFDSPPETTYAGRIVRVFGRIEEYRSKPEIKVSSPEQIVLLDAMPTAQELAGRRRPSTVSRHQRTLRTDGSIVLATYNVENLFDNHDDPYHRDEHTKPKSPADLEKLAATLRELDADVVALQEVENRGSLQRFVDQWLPDAGYGEVVLLEGNDKRGIDVALLSRFPVSKVSSYRHLEFTDANSGGQRYRRDLLQVRLSSPTGFEFDVFVVHFKSKYGGENDESLSLRVAEARATRGVLDQILKADPDARFVLCGDFNDALESDALRTIVGGGSGMLRCFADELPDEQAATYRRAPYRSMIDFIFCSPAMARNYRPGSYRIPEITDADSGSDHNPVVMVFDPAVRSDAVRASAEPQATSNP